MDKIDRTLQVKYCYTEKELNDFLEQLTTSDLAKAFINKLGLLHNIQYLPTPMGKTSETKGRIDTSIVAIVSYWVFVDKEKKD